MSSKFTHRQTRQLVPQPNAAKFVGKQIFEIYLQFQQLVVKIAAQCDCSCDHPLVQ